jgi:mRNA-degrading endonuclease RelE of RelBE toxin-antitoxin system
MLVFRHPKYYKELRKLRNNSDQAISEELDGSNERAPGPGQTKKATSSKSQATSNKHKSQATSSKQQANEG